MRADRLIALVMLLQTRGQITANEAAEELEVSERTARRDLEALSMSGVPIYSQAGRGGGWRLVGGATTNLTGLSADEARALFLNVGPQLDTTELKSAMRKLTAALPETFRDQAMAAAAAVKVDPAGWGHVRGPAEPEFLGVLIGSVVDEKQVMLGYRSPRSGLSTRVVHPLGVVTKRNIWYLVTDTAHGLRVFRVSRVLAVEVLSEPAVRPTGFDLDAVWDTIVTDLEARKNLLEVTVNAAADALTPLKWQFGDRMTVNTQIGANRFNVTLADAEAIALAAQIAGHGNNIELVDAPDQVRAELERITAELNQLYGRVVTSAVSSSLGSSPLGSGDDASQNSTKPT